MTFAGACPLVPHFKRQCPRRFPARLYKGYSAFVLYKGTIRERFSEKKEGKRKKTIHVYKDTIERALFRILCLAMGTRGRAMGAQVTRLRAEAWLPRPRAVVETAGRDAPNRKPSPCCAPCSPGPVHTEREREREKQRERERNRAREREKYIEKERVCLA